MGIDKETVMTSVTQKIAKTKQPKGGYFPINTFKETSIGEPCNDFGVFSLAVGKAVDSLVRFNLGEKKHKAFKWARKTMLERPMTKEKEEMLKAYEKLTIEVNKESVESAILIHFFDTSIQYKKRIDGFILPEDIVRETERMILDTINYLGEEEEINYGFLFPRSLFTENIFNDSRTSPSFFENLKARDISYGEIDFMTETELIDLKLINKKPTKNHTLQIITYYIMGINEYPERFSLINTLCIYNPKLNKKYTLNVSEISDELKSVIEKEVIGHN